jgi:hypothetical protein
MEREKKTDMLLLLSIQNPKRFLELIDIACSDMGPESVQDVGQSYYEEFLGVDNAHISFLMAETLSNFKELLGDASVAGLLDTDDKIFDFLRLFLGMFVSGSLGLDLNHHLLFFKPVGDLPDGPTQKRIDAKIEECRPMLIALYHDFITYLRSPPLTEDQKERLTALQEKCEKHTIEGIFSDDATMTSQEMALFLWKHGYTAFPTVESMLDELEKNIEDTINGTTTPGARYIFQWQVDFVLSDPRGVPVPASHVQELEEVIQAWVHENNLELEYDICVDKYEEPDDAADDDDLYEEIEDTPSKKALECNRQQYCEIHANTLRVLEHLSYVIEAALINCTGDTKYELSRLLDAIYNNPAYEISNSIMVTEQLYRALGYYNNSAHTEGASILSSTIRKLWERIFDGSSEVMKPVDDRL